MQNLQSCCGMWLEATVKLLVHGWSLCTYKNYLLNLSLGKLSYETLFSEKQTEEMQRKSENIDRFYKCQTHHNFVLK